MLAWWSSNACYLELKDVVIINGETEDDHSLIICCTFTIVLIKCRVTKALCSWNITVTINICYSAVHLSVGHSHNYIQCYQGFPFLVPVTFNLDPPKIGSPSERNFLGPTLKNLFTLQASHTKEDQ